MRLLLSLRPRFTGVLVSIASRGNINARNVELYPAALSRTLCAGVGNNGLSDNLRLAEVVRLLHVAYELNSTRARIRCDDHVQHQVVGLRILRLYRYDVQFWWNQLLH